MQDPFRRPAIVPAVTYKDPLAALDWLERAFGFERSMVITDKDGMVAHAEMRFGGGLLYVGSEWAAHLASPAATDGCNTQTIHVHLADGLDAHCERARAAGATIVREPETQFYGDRTYSARDPEGPRLELRPDGRDRVARGGGGSERADDRRVGVSGPMTFDEVRALALAWPGVEDATSYGTPALKVRGKLLARLKEDGDTLVLPGVEPDERDMLVEAAPEVFHFTPHYRDYPIVLARLAAADRPTLEPLLRRRWRAIVPKRLRGGEEP